MLSISSLAVAQTTDFKSYWIINWNVTNLADVFTFPTLQFSAEKRISDKFSLSAGIGYQLYDIHETDTVFLKPRGFKTYIEARYYIIDKIPFDLPHYFDGLYVGLQPFFRKNQYSTGISFYSSPDSFLRKTDNIGVIKNVMGINGILGWQLQVNGRFYVDFYGGMGYMYRKVKNTNRQFNEDKGDYLLGSLFQSYDLSNTNWHSVSFTIGFKAGVRL